MKKVKNNFIFVIHNFFSCRTMSSSDDNLTTDACPNPPIDRKKDVDHDRDHFRNSIDNQEKVEDSDLTTDARPSPPRDDKKDLDESDSDTIHKVPSIEEINTEQKPKTRTFKIPNKARGFGKIPKHNTPTAFDATVINISNSQGVHIGSNITHITNLSNRPDVTCNINRDIPETDAIRDLLKSTAALAREHLIFVSSHIDEGWRDVARALNFSDGEISQKDIDYNRAGIKEVIYQILLDWFRNDDDPTVGKLATTLWNTNQKDAVQRWSKENVRD